MDPSHRRSTPLQSSRTMPEHQYTNLSSQHFSREERNLSVSEIFAQEARKRAEHVLSLRDPGLMRDDEEERVPLKAKVIAFVRNYHMYIMMGGMMIIMSGSMGGTMGKNNGNNLRSGSNQAPLFDNEEGTNTFMPTGFGYFDEEETSTGTFEPTYWGPIECEDDPDFLYQGVKGQDCEWAGAEHLGDRCGHYEVYESCLWTCHPECKEKYAEEEEEEEETSTPEPTEPEEETSTPEPTEPEEVIYEEEEEKIAVALIEPEEEENRISAPTPIEEEEAIFEEETSTSTSTWGPIECVDDPMFLYEGVEGQDCEWAASPEHLGDRCGHIEVYENCLWTCHPECAGTGFPTSFGTSTATSTSTSTRIIDDNVAIGLRS